MCYLESPLNSDRHLEPPESETIGYCCECGQNIFVGEDVWEIRNDLFCECCIDGFKTEIYEKEDEFEFAI